MTKSEFKSLLNETGRQSSDLLKNMPEDKQKAVLDEVSSWLGRLVLLYGVPFHYLIPDVAMLPGGGNEKKGSLRFFFLDPIWIQYLVQGACSIGSNGYGDFIIDRAMNQWVQPNTPDQTNPVKQKAASIRDRLRLEHEGVELPEDNAGLDWPLTGFLLRSPVVEGWRGLEVMAYKKLSAEEWKKWPQEDLTEEQKSRLEKDHVAPLNPLRIEQLSKDVMLGIFNGIIAELVIRQPQEGLHFGVTRETGALSCTKALRELGYKNPKEVGTLLVDKDDKELILPIPMRDQGEKPKYPGVINIAKTAAAMKEILLNKDELKEGKFTSAEFAVELIEAAGEFTYQLNIKSSPLKTRT
ncbi:MAG: hypothetical protein ABFD57_06790 [Smithella sp.]